MSLFLIAGLGNPGASYERTRHNMGFILLDCLKEAFSFSSYKQFSPKLLMAEGKIGLKRVILCRPMTYMNLSGEGLLPCVQFYKVPTHSLCVIHDDIDLPFLKLKIKKGGSSAGHNGLLSIDKTIGVDYWRFRVGVDHPRNIFKHQSQQQVSSYVLSSFSTEELRSIDDFSLVFNRHLPLLFEQALSTSSVTNWLNGFYQSYGN